MTNRDVRRHVEVKDGDQTVATAQVTTSEEPGGTVHASLQAASGHVAPGSRAALVDAVMDLPEVQESARLEAAVPLGDSESLERLRERTEDVTTRPAGSTALLDANIPSDRDSGSGQEPADSRSGQEPDGELSGPGSPLSGRGRTVTSREGPGAAPVADR